MARPLWQLLLLTNGSKKAVQLTCSECFALLEFDADRLVAGVDPAEIRPNVSHHLAMCSNCKTQLEDWLKKLEGDI
jgi:hypothetical protein